MKIIPLLLLGLIPLWISARDATKLQEGKWLLEMESKDIGLARFIITFEVESESFHAYTRRNADREVLGFWTSLLGRSFTNNFEQGSLLRITDGLLKQQGDTLVLAGIFRSAIGSYYFNGHLAHGKMEGSLRNARGEIRGHIRGEKHHGEGPVSNYPEIIADALEITRKMIFRRSLTEGKDWKKFERNVREFAVKAQDDIEMIFAFYYYAGKLPFSHYTLFRMPEDEEPQQKNMAAQLILEEKMPQTALLTIHSFSGSAAEVDSIFKIIRSAGYTRLIVDLRQNPGGSVEAGMAFVRNIADTSFYGGAFLTQKWFNEHEGIPGPDEYSRFPRFSEANFDLIIEGIHREKGLYLQIIPNEETYNEKLYILTGKMTASTCEPIVYGLKQQERALIIGERTAGAMLNGELFPLPDRFSIMIPTADFYAVDGYHIDQKGVAPDVRVKEEMALDHVLKEIISKD